jgi:hypothetical protein
MPKKNLKMPASRPGRWLTIIFLLLGITITRPVLANTDVANYPSPVSIIDSLTAISGTTQYFKTTTTPLTALGLSPGDVLNFDILGTASVNVTTQFNITFTYGTSTICGSVNISTQGFANFSTFVGGIPPIVGNWRAHCTLLISKVGIFGQVTGVTTFEANNNGTISKSSSLSAINETVDTTNTTPLTVAINFNSNSPTSTFTLNSLLLTKTSMFSTTSLVSAGLAVANTQQNLFYGIILFMATSGFFIFYFRRGK